MTLVYIVSSVITILLFAYLVVALFKAEKF